jgi:surface antigen
VVIFISFSYTFASKKQTGSVIAAKILPASVQEKPSYRTLATLASAVDSLSGGVNNQNIKITPEPSLATTSEACLAKPNYASTIISEKQREGVITYTTVPDDTLSSLAVKFGITTNTIKWANNITDANSIKDGQTLVILPVSGVAYLVKNGDTIDSIAGTFGASSEIMVKQNKLKNKDDIRENQLIIVPDGKVPEPIPSEEPASEDNSSYIASAPTADYIPTYRYYGGGGGNFPYGYCTWYANSRHSAPPGAGNAWTWFGAAQAAGWATGYSPAPGAIMVTWESGYGHVAIVDSVHGGSFTVSEMNYAGFGVISSRTITTSSVPLIGFVY